jgi:glutamine---fructose-6-phosphate transaminase (isomerizing)
MPLQVSFSSLFPLGDQPNCLIGVRDKSGLIISTGEKERFLASDNVALIPFTKRLVYLEENDMAIVTAKRVRICNIKVEKIRPISFESSQSYDLGKGKYPH